MLSTLTATTVAAHWGGPWAGGFGWLFLLIPLFWIAVLVLIFTFAGRRWRRAAIARGGYGAGYGYGHGGGWSAGSTRSAEQTLAERFAQGDIDEVEYRARLEVLRANRPGQG
ncbi:SHOCT domain-containing protein [Leifsonia poae]|uniref:SHOCT domain-containing protein n=1 Tax=Leifsonia poae TaxID=110933 RepID=UPI001CBCF405|nr:hypothetical protein [Leifsonia poae]